MRALDTPPHAHPFPPAAACIPSRAPPHPNAHIPFPASRSLRIQPCPQRGKRVRHSRVRAAAAAAPAAAETSMCSSLRRGEGCLDAAAAAACVVPRSARRTADRTAGRAAPAGRRGRKPRDGDPRRCQLRLQLRDRCQASSGTSGSAAVPPAAAVVWKHPSSRRAAAVGGNVVVVRVCTWRAAAGGGLRVRC
eukprot:357916-Chlamydomonas_euryale.AAC.9